MIRFIATLLLKLHGWKLDPNVPKEANRCVMIAAPHTSNWDGYFMILSFLLLRIPMRFTIKEEWTKFPLGLITRPFGALGINRKPKVEGAPRKSYTEAMIDLFEGKDNIAIVVTPEGTRRRRTEWKRGFYYTALGANVPITFGYLDYKRKVAGIGGYLYPTGDMEKDFAVIMNFYKDIHPKYPENWSLDQRFTDKKIQS